MAACVAFTVRSYIVGEALGEALATCRFLASIEMPQMVPYELIGSLESCVTQILVSHILKRWVLFASACVLLPSMSSMVTGTSWGAVCPFNPKVKVMTVLFPSPRVGCKDGDFMSSR